MKAAFSDLLLSLNLVLIVTLTWAGIMVWLDAGLVL
jgi:hypothetical protein